MRTEQGRRRVEAAAERIERELSKDLFGDVAMGSPAADNGLSGLHDLDSFDPLLEAVVSAKWDTFSANGDPERDQGDGHEDEEGRVVVPMSPIRSPPRKDISPTGKYWVLRTVISVQYKSQIFALMRFYYRVPAGR